MNKMTLQELKNLFLPYEPVYKSPDGLETKTGKHAASKRNHRHIHKPTYKPYVADISPAEYRRRHLGATR